MASLLKIEPESPPCSVDRGGECVGWVNRIWLGESSIRARLYCKLKLAEAGMIEEFLYALEHYVYDEATDRIIGDYGEWKVKLEAHESRERLAALGYGPRWLLKPVIGSAVKCNFCGHLVPINFNKVPPLPRGKEPPIIECSYCFHKRTHSPHRGEEGGDTDIMSRKIDAELQHRIACRAVERKLRDCKGPMDCDGTCWRGPWKPQAEEHSNEAETDS